MPRQSRTRADSYEWQAWRIIMLIALVMVVTMVAVAGIEIGFIVTTVFAVAAAPARMSLARWLRSRKS
jgi:hypothetical protein